MEFWTIFVLALLANKVAPRRLPSEVVTCPSVCLESQRLGFQSGQSYIYNYEAQTVSHVTGTADQAATLGFTSDVIVKVLSSCEFLVKFKNVESSSENAKELSDALTRHPLQASWQDGDVTGLCSHSNDPKWVLNVKRGFLSSLQNNQQTQLVESDVIGDCMTSYERTESINGGFNVRKTKDFNKCLGERFETNSAILFNKYDADSTRKSLLDSAQECNETWSAVGVLEHSVCVEKHLFRPFSYRGNGAETVVNQNMRLVSTQPISDDVERLTENEVRRTTIKFEHEDNQNTITDEQTEIMTSLENVCDLINNNAPSAEIPAAFLQIITALKPLSKSTIQSIWKNIESGIICPEQQKKIRQMFLDAVPMCTSSECVKFSVTMINNDVINPSEKANWVSAFSMISNPSEKIIEAILPLLQATPISTEAFLTTGTLIHRFCFDKTNCVKYVAVSQALDVLQEPLGANCHTTNEESTKRIILSLRSLGNAGLATSASTLSACAMEERNLADVRIAAMSAFRRMLCDEDRSAMRSILSDVTEDSEIRVSAYVTLMQCPNLALVRHLVAMLDTEEVNQVGSYIWSHIMEVKSSSDPLKSYIQSLLAGTKLSEKFSKDKRKYSSYYEKSLYSETLNLGGELDGDLVWSTKSFIPRSARLNLTVDLFGAAFNLFEIGGRVQGIERELERLFGPAAKDNAFLSTIFGVQNNREKRDAVAKYDEKVSQIQQNNNVKEENLSAQIFMRMFGNEILYKSFGSEIAEQSNSGSWFGGFRTLMQLATSGSEYLMQNNRLLIDSQVTMPTMTGFPLNLKVTGTSSVDVSIGGQLDISRILLEGFNIQGHLRPKAAVDILATMTSQLGHVAKAGLDLQSTLATSMDVNGTISLVDGQNFRLKIDAPQEKMDVFSYKSNIFVVEDNQRNKLVPHSDVMTSQWCSDTGSDVLGIQICSVFSKTLSSNLADDTAPFFPFNGNSEFSFDIRKTDPLLTHYLIETNYNWEQMEDSSMPEQLTAHFFVGTPGSAVNRDSQLDLVFSANQNNVHMRVATNQNSIELIGNRVNKENLKSAELSLIIDEMKTYKMAGELNYEKSRTGGHIWNGNAYVSTPQTKNSRPTITGNLAYSNLQQFESSIEVTNVLAEPITIQVDLEKVGGDIKSTYTGNAQATIPGYLDVSSTLRSSTNHGNDKTQLTINYSVLGLTTQSVQLSHKYKTSDSENGENWSISTDVSFTQFPSINHQVSLKHKATETGYDSALNIAYGTNYNAEDNIRRFAIKQVISNLTNADKTHLEGSWSLAIPEYEVDYRATLTHIYDWNTVADKVILLSGSFRQSKDSKPLSLHLRASDQSTDSLTQIESEGTLSTAWGDLSALQRLTQIGEGRFNVFGNYGLGKAVGLQVQIVGNITNLPQNKHISVHVYRPQSSNNNVISDESKSTKEMATWNLMQRSDVFEDIATFSTTWNNDNTDLLNNGDFHMNGQFELESRWNDKLSLTGSLSKATTGFTPQTLTIKRLDVTFSHPTKEVRFYSDIQQDETNSLSPSVNSHLSTSSLTTRFEWTDDTPVRKHFGFLTQFDRLTPKTNEVWQTEENRLSAKLQLSHNEPRFENYLSSEFNVDLSIFAKPVEEPESYDFERSFGSTFSVSGPTSFGENAVEFNTIFDIKFTSLKDMSTKCLLTFNLPTQVTVLNVALPNTFKITKSLKINPDSGVKFSADALFNSEERFLISGDLTIEDNDRYTSNFVLKQNLQQFSGVYETLPKDANFNAEFQNNNAGIVLSFVSRSNEVIVLQSNFNVDYNDNRLSITTTQDLPILINNNIPRSFEIVARKSPNVDFGGSLIMTSYSTEVLTTRLSVSKSAADQNQNRFHLTIDHGLTSLTSFPQSSELIVKVTNRPQAFEVTVQTAVNDETSTSNFMVQLPTSDQGFNVNIDQTHDVEMLLEAGIPSNSKFNLEINENRDAVDIVVRLGNQRLKLNINSIQEVIRHNNRIKNTLEMDLSHNIDFLTSKNIPARLKSTLRAEDGIDQDTNAMTTVYSIHITAEDEIIQSSVTLVRTKSDNNIPVGLEVRVSLHHDMQRLMNANLPADLQVQASMQKTDSGFSLKILTNYDYIRKHFDVSVTAQENDDSTRYSVQINQNLETLTEMFGLPGQISASFNIKPVSLYFGFNVVGRLDLGEDKSWRISTKFDGNSSSIEYNIANELSIPSIISLGVPGSLQFNSIAVGSFDDKLASFDLQYSVNNENEEIHIKFAAQDGKKPNEEIYQMNLDHTFESLTSFYDIPLSTQVILTGKVIGWTYAKGSVEVTADKVEKFFRFHSGYRYDSDNKEYKLDYAMRHNLGDEDKETEPSPVKISLSLRTVQPQSLSWDFGFSGERFRGGFNFDFTGPDLTYSMGYNLKHTLDVLLNYGLPKRQKCSVTIYAGNENTFGYEIKMGTVKSDVSLLTKVTYTPGNDEESLIFEFGAEQNAFDNFPTNVLMQTSVLREGADKLTLNIDSNIEKSKTHVDISYTTEPESYEFFSRKTIEINRSDFDMFSDYIEDLKHFPTSAKITCANTRDRNRVNIDFDLSYPGSRSFQVNFNVGQTRQNYQDIDATFEVTNTAVKLREFGVPDSVNGGFTSRVESNGELTTIVCSANIRTSSEQSVNVDVTFRQLPDNRYEVSYITAQNFAFLEEMLYYPRELQSTLRLTLSNDQTSIRVRGLLDGTSKFVQLIALTPEQTTGSQFQISRSIQLSHDITTLSEEWLIPRDLEVIFDVTARQGQDYELNFPFTNHKDVRTSVTINIHQSRFFETSLIYRGLIEEIEATFLLQHESEVLTTLTIPGNNRVNVKVQAAADNQIIEVETSFDSRENNIVIRTTNQVISKGSKRAQNEASFSINHDIQQLADYIPFTVKLTGRKMVRKVFPSFEVGAILWLGRSKIDLSLEGHPVPVSETQSGFSLRGLIDQDFATLSSVGVPENVDVTVTAMPIDIPNGMGRTLRVGVNRNNNVVNSMVVTVTRDDRDGSNINFKLNQDFPELINLNIPQETQSSVSAKYGLGNNEIIVGLCFNSQCIQISPAFELDLSTTVIKGSLKFEHRFDFLEEYEIPRSFEFDIGAEVVPQGASIKLSSMYNDEKFDFYTGFNVSLSNGEWSLGSRVDHTIGMLENDYGIPLTSNWQLSYEIPRRSRSVLTHTFKFGENLMTSRFVYTSGENPSSTDITITSTHNLVKLQEMNLPSEFLISGSLQEISNGFSFQGKLCLDELVANLTVSGQKTENGNYEVRLGNQHNSDNSFISQNFDFNFIIGTRENGAYISEIRATRDRKMNLVRVTSNSDFNFKTNTLTFDANIHQDLTQELDETSFWSKLASRLEISFEGTLNSNRADLNIHSVVDDGVFDVMYAHEKQTEDNWSVRGALTQTLPQLTDLISSHTSFTGDVNRIENGFSSDIQLEYDDVSDTVHGEVTLAFNEDTRRDELVFIMNHDVQQWVGIPRQIRSTFYMGKDDGEVSKTFNVGILCQFDQHQTHASFQSSIQQVNFQGSQPRSSIRYYIDIGHDYPSFEENYNMPQTVQFSMENTPVVNGISSVTTFSRNQDEKRFSWTLTCGQNEETLRSEITLDIEHNIKTLSSSFRLPSSLSANVYSVNHNGWSSRTLGCKFLSEEKSVESSMSYILDFTEDISLRINMESKVKEMPLLLEYIPASISTTTNVQIEKKSVSVSHEQTINDAVENFVLTSRLSNRNKQLTELSITMNQNLNLLNAIDIPTDARVMFSYGTNSEPRSTISMDITYGTKTMHATLVTSILENRLRSTVVLQHTFDELLSYNIPEDTRIAASTQWSENSFNAAFEYSLGDTGSQRSEITLSYGENQDENNRKEWKMLFDHSFRCLTAVNVLMEVAVILFYSSPNTNSHYTGLEIDADSYSLNVKTNIKARSTDSINKFDLTVRGRHNVPYLHELNIPRIWRSVLKVSTQSQQCSISIQTTADGVDKTVLNIKSKMIWTTEIMNVQLNISYDLTAVEQYVNIPIVGDISISMNSENNIPKMSVVSVDLGQEFFVLNYKSSLNIEETNIWLYNSEYDFKHDIAMLSYIGLPMSGNSKVSSKLSLESSSLSMNSEVTQGINQTPTNFNFVVSFDRNETSTVINLFLDQNVDILINLYIPQNVTLSSTTEMQKNVLNAEILIRFDDINISLSSNFGVYADNKYGLKMGFTSFGFNSVLPQNIGSESYININGNQVTGFGFSANYGENIINGNTSWNCSSPSFQIISLGSHNFDELQEYIPSNIQLIVMINQDSNNVNMVSKVITPTQENQFNIAVNVQNNPEKNNRHKLIISVNQTIPLLADFGMPTQNKICLHNLIEESSVEIGIMSEFDENNLEASFKLANPKEKTLKFDAIMHQNFANLPVGGKLDLSIEFTNRLNVQATLTKDDQLDQPIEFNLVGSAGKTQENDATKYQVKVKVGHNIELISVYLPFNVSGNAYVDCRGMLNGQLGMKAKVNDIELGFAEMNLTLSEHFNSLQMSNLVRYLDQETKQTNSYSTSTFIKYTAGPKCSLEINVDVINNGASSYINGEVNTDFAMPNFKVTTNFTQNNEYLSQTLQVPQLITSLVAIQLPTASNLVLSGSARLTIDENQLFIIEGITNANVVMPGSEANQWGKLDVISIFQHNVPFLADKAPNDVTMNLNLARNNILDIDFNFDVTSDGSKKFITISTAQTVDEKENTRIQLNVSHNLSAEQMDLSIDLSGKLIENGEGFSYSMNVDQNGIKQNVGEIFYSRSYDENSQQNQLQFTFKHSVQSLKDLYIPNNFVLSAQKEIQANDVTVYSYNLQFDDTTNSYTLTLSPNSFEIVNNHDWVTLTLITGLPYSTYITGNVQGDEYPFKTVEFSYTGDLQELKFTFGINKQVDLNTEYNVQGDISHNMKTWEILGMPMKNNLNIVMSTTQDNVEINSVTTIKDQVMTTQLTYIKGSGLSYNLVITSTNNITKLTDCGYPNKMALRGEISSTTENMVDSSLVFSINDETKLRFKLTADHQSQNWPETGSIDLTTLLTNNLDLLTNKGVPLSSEVVISLDKTSSSTLSGSCDITVDDKLVLRSSLNKREGSAFTFTVGFGDSYSVSVRDFIAMNSGASGVNFEADFGTNEIMNSIGFRYDPTVLFDATLTIDPAALPQLQPFTLSALFIKDEDNITSGNAAFKFGNETLGLKLKNAISTFVSNNKWSVVYSAKIFNNMTLLRENINMPEIVKISEGTYVNSEPGTSFKYELVMTQGTEDTNIVTADFNVKNSDNWLTESTLSVAHEIQQIVEYIPLDFEIFVANKFEFTNDSGLVAVLNTKYSSADDIMAQFSLKAAMESELNANTYTFEVGSSHKNIEKLATILPLGEGENNTISFNFTFNDVNDMVENGIYNIKKNIKIELSSKERKASFDALINNRNTGEEFSSYDITIKSNQDVPELQDMGVFKKVDIEIGTFSYSDSAKLNSQFSWINSEDQSKSYNVSSQYNGGFPTEIYGSHSLSIYFAQLEEVNSKFNLNWDLDLAEDRQTSDLRIRINESEEFKVQGSFDATQSGVMEVDFTMLEPNEITMLNKVEISGTLSQKNKRSFLQGKVAVDDQDPTLLSVSVRDLTNSGFEPSGKDFTLTFEPGLVALMWPNINKKIFAEAMFEKTNELTEVMVNCTQGHVTLSADFSLDSQDNYITIDTNIHQPFKNLMSYDLPNQLKTNIVFDARNEQRISTTLLIDSDELEHNILLTGVVMQNYLNTMFGFESSLRTSNNSSDDINVSLKLDNNTYDLDTNYTLQIAGYQDSKSISIFLNGELACNENNNKIVVDFNQFGFTISNTKALDHIFVTVNSPIFDDVTMTFTKSLNQDESKYSVRIDLSTAISFEIFVILGDQEFTLSTGFIQDQKSFYVGTPLSWKREQPFIKLQISEDKTDYDVITASATMLPSGWLQLRLSSDKKKFKVFALNLNHLLKGVENYYDIIEEKSTAFVTRLSKKLDAEQIEKLNNFMTKLFEFCDQSENMLKILVNKAKQASQVVKNNQVPNTLDGVNQQVQNLIRSFGMPIDNLKEVYYDSFINQLKNDVDVSVLGLIDSSVQTKVEWMIVNSINEIVNHNLDNLACNVYAAVSGSIPPMDNLFEIEEELFIVTIPTVYNLDTSKGFPGVNAIRDWLAGTLVTTTIKDFMNYSLKDKYYRFLAAWRAESSFPFFPGHASVINGKQIVTFDGKVIDIKGSKCAHLLSHDFLDKNFSLIMQRSQDEVMAFMIKTQDSEGQDFSLQIRNDNTVSVNGDLVTLPFNNDITMISRNHAGVTATLRNKDIKLICSNLFGTVCHLHLGPFYHGRVNGLMGTMDNEENNDLMTSQGDKYSEGDSQEGQDSWGVSPDSSLTSCGVNFPDENDCVVPENCEVFTSYDSTLRSCFPVLDPKPYLEACKRISCSRKDSCALAQTYRTKCEKLGAFVSLPEHCSTCAPKIVTVSAPVLVNESKPIDTVFVLERGDCIESLIEKIPRLLRYMEVSAEGSHRFGLVTYNSNSVQLVTVDNQGQLFGSTHDLEKMLRRVDSAEASSGGNMALNAVKEAALFPFDEVAKKNVIMMSCSNCDRTNEMTISQISETFNNLGISFHLLKNQVIQTSADGNKKHLVVGYDNNGAYTKKSLRAKSFEPMPSVLKLIDFPKNDECSSMISYVSGGSIWNSGALAKRSSSAGKSVTEAVAKKISDFGSLLTPSGVVAEAMCRDCKCVTVAPNGLARSVCTPC